jgi:hypothetical protein
MHKPLWLIYVWIWGTGNDLNKEKNEDQMSLKALNIE